jgi:hypothetical protein
MFFVSIFLALLNLALANLYEWKHVEDSFGLIPKAKYQHSSWVIDRVLYVFGGCDESLL